MIRGILLDIEGTTSSISFVHDVMFPFVLERLPGFLNENLRREDVLTACQQIAREADFESLEQWQISSGGEPLAKILENQIRALMARDIKSTGLKALQGLIWQGGFESGQLQAHVYPDVIPAIQRWRRQHLDVRIYSSGSVAAQKLFFGHLAEHGDCLSLFSGHYDTNIGGKKEPASYVTIASDWGLTTDNILFISDVAEELEAARSVGTQVLASVRPGNQPLPKDFDVTVIHSFDEVELETLLNSGSA